MILIKNWFEAQDEAYRVRDSVFIREQGVPEALEIDEFDPQAHHALAYQGSQCIGTARLAVLTPQDGRIGRMAVLKGHRSQGVGKQLLHTLIELGKNHGLRQLELHAQLTAISFYEQFGFIAIGKSYDEAGIAHRDMILHILP